jgi:signal transduction histidine kinase
MVLADSRSANAKNQQSDYPSFPQLASTEDGLWRAPGQQVSGSGLGLTIVRQAARQMGGRVRVEDALSGRGIAFVLCLPKTAQQCR